MYDILIFPNGEVTRRSDVCVPDKTQHGRFGPAPRPEVSDFTEYHGLIVESAGLEPLDQHCLASNAFGRD
jgi:hypothetical protein